MLKFAKVPGCSLILDRGIFFPETLFEWYAWFLLQTALVFFCVVVLLDFVLHGVLWPTCTQKRFVDAKAEMKQHREMVNPPSRAV